MADAQKLTSTVIRTLNIDPSAYRDDLKIGDIPQWDSLAHLSLMFAIEDAYGLQFESNLIPKLTSLPLIRAELERMTQGR